ncbi:MAG: U32 family peptidase C-terminal domain-containing protein [Succinivibrio sp.]|nr:U32 family peptidase C-terminal domain-containing protein [Succinivibrio sp.]
MTISRKPELLAPAGSLEHVRMALSYGADAVYAGVPRWSLRVRGNGFSLEDFAEGIALSHQLGKRFHAVLNAIPHARRTQSFLPALDEIAALKPDAFIMADPGLISIVRERYPEIPIHLSVQANTVNAWSVKFWQKIGVTRCILARELTLSEIAMIRADCPDMELEVFAHGALCIAVSGRCLISGLLARRDANVGACNNACRWAFNTRNIRVMTAELEDQFNHPGEWMELEEDAHGSYLMNSKDLCTLPLLDKLMEIGVDSLKIEGRSRSPFYSAIVSRAYRLGIDAVAEGRDVPEEAQYLVNSIMSRKYTTALLVPHRPDETQDYETNTPTRGRLEIVGSLTAQDTDGTLTIEVKNHFENTSRLLISTPEGLIPLDASALCDLKGEPLSVAKGSGWTVKLPCDRQLDLSTAVLLCEQD